jgi:hypothetical protein
MSSYVAVPMIAAVFSVLCLTNEATQAQSTAAEHQATTIRGIVMNSVTREPIGRALVVSSDNRFATRTDNEGHFEFTISRNEAFLNPEPGGAQSVMSSSDASGTVSFALTARKPGFLHAHDAMVNIQKGALDQELTIELTPEALIVGRVTLPTSDISDRVGLNLYRRQVQDGRARWQIVGRATTKSNGLFRFSELTAGTYKLFSEESLDRDPSTSIPGAQLFGYPPIFYPTASDFAAAGTIILSAGQTFQAELSPLRQPYYQIKIPVKNADALAGLEVRVLMQGHRGPGYSLGYNDQEQSIEGMLPNGTYTIEAASFEPSGASGSLNITVKGGPVQGAALSLVPNGNITVKVKQEFTSSENRDQAAMSEAVIERERSGTNTTVQGGGPPASQLVNNVMLEPVDDFNLWRGTGFTSLSSPQGEFLTLNNVIPGRYRVGVNPARGYVSALSSGGVDLLKHPLVVAHGVATPPIEVTLRDDTAQIDGTIEGIASKLLGTGLTDSGSAAVAGHGYVGTVSAESPPFVYCVPLPDSAGRFAEIPASTDGKFSYPLQPGAYRVFAFRHQQPDLEYHNPEAMRAYDSMGQMVRVVAGQTESLQLHLISPEH